MAVPTAIDQELMARLRRVGLTARQAVAALQAGAHRSLHRGLSLEFAGHRPYQPGDDLRRLDWLVWARSDRHELRLYQEETRLCATLVLDASGSMAYGGRWRTAQLVAAALALVMAGQGDAVGLVLGDRGIRSHLPPAGGMGHLLRLLARIEEAEPSGGTNLPLLLEELVPQLRRRGLVVVVSDLLLEPASLARALARLRHRRQDLRAFRLVHPDEARLPWRGDVELEGLEGEEALAVAADRLRPRYQVAWAEHGRALAAACHGCGVPLTELNCTDDPVNSLLRALDRRGGTT